MCFSVNVNLVKEELENRYGASLIDPDKYRPSYYYHAFAFPEMPVICQEDPKHIKLFTWGLIPSHTLDSDEAHEIRSKTFNARAESLKSRKTFALSYESKRCLVPVRGFYEWQHKGSDKIPWYIYHSENQIISLAGLYDQWIVSESGEVFNTFSIITTEANKMMAEIHNSTRRMPAILETEFEKIWLNPDIHERELRSLLGPLRENILGAHTVSPLVNSRVADKNTADVIKPYNYNIQGSLF
ncbi:MAG TPA: SOS response-associated peptidase [Bacteroidales bacterium]|nr:SOS response-associated peptidase [Bacteroidales bacterium]